MAASPIQLSAEQVKNYHDNGYLIVENLLTDQEIEAFLSNEARPEIQAQWEDLGLHLKDEVRNYIAKHPNIAGVAAQLLGGKTRIVQTMYLPKEPAVSDDKTKNVGIALHQDTHYLPNEPNTLMACWIAMNDTDSENGGLCVVPKSHLDGLYSTHQTKEHEEHVSWEIEYLMRDPDGREYKKKFYSFEIDGLDHNNIAKLTAPKGAGVFFNGMTIHGSYANRSQTRWRKAFAVHYVKDGTWVYRADVQQTDAVDKFSTLKS